MRAGFQSGHSPQQGLALDQPGILQGPQPNVRPRVALRHTAEMSVQGTCSEEKMLPALLAMWPTLEVNTRDGT
jgi:hypothetical protein